MIPPCPTGSGRLRFRRFAASDAAALQAMHRDPRVRALLIDDHGFEQAAVAQRFVHGVQAVYATHPGLGLWWTERALPLDPACRAQAAAAVAAGELEPVALEWLRAPAWAFCGWFNLMPMPMDPGRVEIGCRLRPEAWGTGLAEHGGELLLAHAFEALGRDEVWGVCHPQHRAVQVVLLTLGFEPQGLRPYDEVPQAAWFRLARSDWAAGLGQPRRLRRRAALQALHRQQMDTPGPGPIPGCRGGAQALNSPHA